MPLFQAKTRSTRQADSKVISKLQAPKASGAISLKGGETLFTRIKEIELLVNTKLGHHAQEYCVLRTEEEVRDYVYNCCNSEWVTLDFETSGVDPLVDVIAGTVLYSEGQKPCYIPQNHQSYVTNVRYKNQLEDAFIKEQLQKLNQSKALLEYDNAKFDFRIGRHYLGVEMRIDWDTDVAAHMLNENEPFYALKKLHYKYCDSTDDFGYSYSDLFKGIPFHLIPINTGYLYAAGDGPKTDELRQFQMQHLNAEKLPGVYKVYMDIELPLIPVTARMEDIGIGIRADFQQQLSEQYHSMFAKAKEEYDAEIEKLKPTILQWCADYNGTKEAAMLRGLDISPSSSKKLAVLFYDVLRCRPVSKDSPRGTGEDILKQLDLPICNKILKMRGISKLLSTYIDKMPTVINATTGMIHANFHQNGTVTGRYSSSDPNMQNIPSKNKDIRKMFWAGDGWYLVSCDYSQQEPRILAFVSHDEQFREAYVKGRDLYAECASKIFGVPYEDCQEFFPDGTENPEGGKRRYFCKGVILGLMYGRGAAAIAEQCKISTKEAQRIINDFYEGFPGVKQWMDALLETARITGYVETVMGRKRRFPELLLPEYEFRYTKEAQSKHFDPLDFGGGPGDVEVPQSVIDAYMKKINAAHGFKAINAIIRAARENDIIIKDNTAEIARAERQAVNAVIQGSAADMTKMCMNRMHRDPELLRINTEAILQVHDELICRAPKEHIIPATRRISEIMIEVAQEMIPIDIKWKCDTVVTEYWYGPEINIQEVA